MTEKFHVVCYQRISCEVTEPLTWNEATRVREKLEHTYPENFYVIEEVKE